MRPLSIRATPLFALALCLILVRPAALLAQDCVVSVGVAAGTTVQDLTVVNGRWLFPDTRNTTFFSTTHAGYFQLTGTVRVQQQSDFGGAQDVDYKKFLISVDGVLVDSEAPRKPTNPPAGWTGGFAGLNTIFETKDISPVQLFLAAGAHSLTIFFSGDCQPTSEFNTHGIFGVFSGQLTCATPSIQASLSAFSISCGQSSQVVTATGSPAGGTFSDWAVSDTRVATIGAVSGNQATITAVAGGQAILSVKYSNVGETILATRAFTVTSEFTASLAGPTSVTCGATADYALTLSSPHPGATVTTSFDAGGNLVDVLASGPSGVRLHFKDPGPAPAQVVLRVDVTETGCSPATATFAIQLARPVLTLAAAASTIAVGETTTVTLGGAPAGEPVTWGTSPVLAFVDANTAGTSRTVKGVSPSTAATVTAQVCGVTASVTIEVLGGVARRSTRTTGADGSNTGEPPPADGSGGDGGGGVPPEPEPTSCEEPGPANATGTGDVYLHNGEEHMRTTDLFVRGRGEIDFHMTREYRSRVRFDGPLGQGWDFGYNERLTLLANGDALHENGFGRTDTYARQLDGTFRSPAGFFCMLRRLEDGSYAMRGRRGFKRFFDAQGNLVAYEDRNKNRMRFVHDAQGRLAQAIDPFERVYTFTWREDGRLASVSDFAGRTVSYGYSDSHDLVSVTSPAITGTSTGNDFPTGRTWRYAYSSGFADEDLNHNLLTMTAPEEVASGGPPRLQITYGTDASDPLTYDKVVSILKGGTNASGVPAGGTWAFSYGPPDTTYAFPPDVVRQASVTDPDGDVMVEAIDAAGRLRVAMHKSRGLRAGEPAMFCTFFEYTDDSLVARATRPLGNATEFVYAGGSAPRFAQGNLLQVRLVPDAARGGGDPLVTRFGYEPLYNEIASITDPRGFAPSFTPPMGGATPERYTTRFFYDYQEGSGAIAEASDYGIDLSGVPRGLGDLNGDGRTDQIAGNVVRVEAPTVTLLAGSNEAQLRGSTVQPIVTQTAWNDAGQIVRAVDPEGNVQTIDYFPENDPDGDGTLVPGATSALARGYAKTVVRDAELNARNRSGLPPARIATSFAYDPLGRVTSVLNARGVVTAFEWSAADELVATTRAKDVSAARATGQLLLTDPAPACVRRVEVENRNGNAPELGAFIERTFDYDILDHLVAATARVDAQRTLTTTFRYASNEALELVTKPEGNKTKIEYDERHLVFRVTRGLGSNSASTVQRNYDANGNLAEVLDAEHRRLDRTPTRTTFGYDGFDRLATVTDTLGGSLVNTFDSASALVRQQLFGHPPGRPGDPVALLAERRLARDELSRVFQIDVPLFLAHGFTTRRPVDLREGSLTPNDGLVTTRFEHDALSRRTFVVEDDRQTWQTIFDGASRAVATIDPLGNRREVNFDQGSNPVRVRSIEVSPEGLVPQETFEAIYVWDALDRLARVTDNAGQTATLGHDSRDNLIQTADAVGALLNDPLGLYARGTINDRGNTVHFFHDGLNRLVKKVMDLRSGSDGSGAVVGRITSSYLWDGNSRLTGLFDDKQNATVYQFDELDRPVKEVSADGTFRTTEYDRDDNPVRSVDANGTEVLRTFDVLNRLASASVTFGASWNVGGTTAQTFEYDGLSRLTRALDKAGAKTSEVGFVYDSLSRVLEEVQDGLVVSSVWAGDGRKLACTYASGTKLDYSHDSLKRLNSIREGPSSVAAWDWIGPGLRPLRRSSENGVTLSFLDDAGRADVGWDAVQRVAQMRYVGRHGEPLVDLGYSYDRANNRTTEARFHEGRADAFSYDSAYRLISAQYDVPLVGAREDGAKGGLGVLQEVFALDGVGNRVSLTQVLASKEPGGHENGHDQGEGQKRGHDDRGHGAKAGGAVVTGYAVNAVNEYTSVGDFAQVHDPAGCLRDDGRFSYRYDFRNLLVEVTEKLTERAAAYRYDALGRRIEKRFGRPFEARRDDEEGEDCGEALSSGFHVRRYVHDGARVIEERREDGGWKEWVYGVGLDEPLRQVTREPGKTEQRVYYCQNAIGSVVALTNAGGQVVERYRYEAFGREIVLNKEGGRRRHSAFGNPWRFQGRWRDSEEGSPLYCYMTRYLDPRTGRFTSRDAVWDAGNLGNAYSFVGNSPVNFVDPMGLQAEKQWYSYKQLELAWELRELNAQIGALGDVSSHKLKLIQTQRDYAMFALELQIKDDNWKGSQWQEGVFRLEPQSQAAGPTVPQSGSGSVVQSVVKFVTGYDIDATAVQPQRDQSGRVTPEALAAAIQASQAKAVQAAGTFVSQTGFNLVTAAAAQAAKIASKFKGLGGPTWFKTQATLSNYRDRFLKAVPNLPRGWEVHHALPHTKYADLLKKEFGINVHELQWLRGVDPDVHGRISAAWTRWECGLGRPATGAEVLDFAAQIEQQFGKYFIHAR